MSRPWLSSPSVPLHHLDPRQLSPKQMREPWIAWARGAASTASAIRSKAPAGWRHRLFDDQKKWLDRQVIHVCGSIRPRTACDGELPDVQLPVDRQLLLIASPELAALDPDRGAVCHARLSRRIVALIGGSVLASNEMPPRRVPKMPMQRPFHQGGVRAEALTTEV